MDNESKEHVEKYGNGFLYHKNVLGIMSAEMYSDYKAELSDIENEEISDVEKRKKIEILKDRYRIIAFEGSYKSNNKGYDYFKSIYKISLDDYHKYLSELENVETYEEEKRVNGRFLKKALDNEYGGIAGIMKG